MGHIDEGDAEFLVHFLQLYLHILAHLEVKGGKRLVEEQYLRLVHKGPCYGDALLLTAGEGLHVTVFVVGHTHHLEHPAHPLVHLVGRHLLELEAEGNVVVNVKVREKRITLKHGVERSLVRRQGGNILAIEEHGALIRGKEARQDAEGRGLAAARRTEQGHKLTFSYIQTYIVEDGLSTQLLTYILQREDDI